MNERLVRTASHWGAFWVQRPRRPRGRRASRSRRTSTRRRWRNPRWRRSTTQAASIGRMFARASWSAAQPATARSEAPSRSCRSIGTPRWSWSSDELTRVKSAFGNRSIFAGSYGWSSAGRLHHAKSLLHRFMNLRRRCDGASRHLFQRRRLGHHAACARRHHRDQRSGHDFRHASPPTRDLFVSFGGMPLKNLQIDSGGTGEHSSQTSIPALAGRGIEFVCISPLRTD